VQKIPQIALLQSISKNSAIRSHSRTDIVAFAFYRQDSGTANIAGIGQSAAPFEFAERQSASGRGV
jgi:hypothetical protein